MQPHIPNPLIPKLEPNCIVRVIGLGGVGEKVARYVAMFMAAQDTPCRLILIDGDHFEPSNATRMFFSDYGNKARAIARELQPRFMESKLVIDHIQEYITPENIAGMIREGDIVLLCLDNHKSRKLISKQCEALKNVTLISGGNDGVGPDSSGKLLRGTFGNVQCYLRKDSVDLSPSLTQFHDEIEHPKDKMPHEKSCTENMLRVPQLLFINLATASAMCNAFFMHVCGALHFGEACFDAAEMRMATSFPIDYATPENKA